jgi:hypothetical protein
LSAPSVKLKRWPACQMRWLSLPGQDGGVGVACMWSRSVASRAMMGHESWHQSSFSTLLFPCMRIQEGPSYCSHTSNSSHTFYCGSTRHDCSLRANGYIKDPLWFLFLFMICYCKLYMSVRTITRSLMFHTIFIIEFVHFRYKIWCNLPKFLIVCVCVFMKHTEMSVVNSSRRWTMMTCGPSIKNIES